MKMRQYAAVAVAGVVLLGACGSDKKTETAATTAATTAASSAASTAGSTAATTPVSTQSGATIDCKPVKAGVLSVVTSLPGPNFWGTTNAEVDPDKIKSGIEFDMANDIATKC